jgi:hypothetical protein
MKRMFSLIAIVLLAGCAAQKMTTKSGRPEVTVNADRGKTRAALQNYLVDSGYLIFQDSDTIIVADRSAGAWLNFWFTNTLTGESPRVRTRFNLIETGDTTRVIASIGMVHAPGFNGRVSEDELLNRRAYEDLQWFLDCVRADLEGMPRPEKPVYKVEQARSPKGNL